MSTVRTRDEALLTLDSALGRWLDEFTSSFATSSATVARLSDEAEQTRAAFLRIAAQHQMAEQSAAAAAAFEAAAAELAGLVRRYGELQLRLESQRRQLDGAISSNTTAARGDLRRRLGEVARYRGEGASLISSPMAGVPEKGQTQEDGTLRSYGLTEIPVSSMNFEDNPIEGKFGRGETNSGDYRWAVETWHTVVSPGVKSGMTREDFERRDTERNAGLFRQSAKVYDLFLGDTDRLRLSPRQDGTYDVVNGRHRVQVARELGINALPASLPNES